MGNAGTKGPSPPNLHSLTRHHLSHPPHSRHDALLLLDLVRPLFPPLLRAVDHLHHTGLLLGDPVTGEIKVDPRGITWDRERGIVGIEKRGLVEYVVPAFRARDVGHVKRVVAFVMLRCEWDEGFVGRPLEDLACELEKGWLIEVAEFVRCSFSSVGRMERHPLMSVPVLGSQSLPVAASSSVPATTVATPEPPTLLHWCQTISPTPPSSRAAVLARLEDNRLRQLVGSVVDLIRTQHGSGRSVARATALTIHVNTVSVTAFLLSDLQQAFFPRVAVLDLDSEINAVKRLIACSLLGYNWDQTFLARPLVPDLARDLEDGFWLEAADLLRSSFPSLDALNQHPFFWTETQQLDFFMELGANLGNWAHTGDPRIDAFEAAAKALAQTTSGDLTWFGCPPVLLRHMGSMNPSKLDFFVCHTGTGCRNNEHREQFNLGYAGATRNGKVLAALPLSACPGPSSPDPTEPCACGFTCNKCDFLESFHAFLYQFYNALKHSREWEHPKVSDEADLIALFGPAASRKEGIFRYFVWPATNAVLPPFLARGDLLVLAYNASKTL